jgi:chromosomal replication initiator protein
MMSNETIDLASKELWERAKNFYLSMLQSQDERSQIERYLSMVTTVAKEDDCFVIYTANEYAADFLKSNYLQKFKNCLEFASGAKDLCIEFRFDRNAQPAIVVPQIKQKTPTVKQSRVSSFISTMPLNEEYTFDEFVRGPSNSFALAAAMGAANNPGKSMYNPLFIHGGSGLGKTHLMQAIGNELKKRDASLAICYLTAEEFLNEYVNYLAKKGLPDFRNKYRSIDVLLLDDVQFFQRGKDIQEEFFNTFNALQQQHKQIVMTSDVAPKDLPAIETRLITRFEGGIVQEIESPSYETRLAILRKKAEGMIPKVPDAVLEFIADNIKSHVRAMEGALGKVSIYLNSFPEIIPSNEILSHLLKDSIEKEKTIRKLTIEEIQNLVSNKYGVSMNQILSSERTQSIVTPRQLAMYIARKYTTKSLPEIAKKFDKTHATILHGVKSIEKRLDVENDLKATLAEILSEFGYKLSDKME